MLFRSCGIPYPFDSLCQGIRKTRDSAVLPRPAITGIGLRLLRDEVSGHQPCHRVAVGSGCDLACRRAATACAPASRCGAWPCRMRCRARFRNPDGRVIRSLEIAKSRGERSMSGRFAGSLARALLVAFGLLAGTAAAQDEQSAAILAKFNGLWVG